MKVSYDDTRKLGMTDTIVIYLGKHNFFLLTGSNTNKVLNLRQHMVLTTIRKKVSLVSLLRIISYL